MDNPSETTEELLKRLIDRLHDIQVSPEAGDATQHALDCCRTALWLVQLSAEMVQLRLAITENRDLYVRTIATDRVA